MRRVTIVGCVPAVVLGLAVGAVSAGDLCLGELNGLNESALCTTHAPVPNGYVGYSEFGSACTLDEFLCLLPSNKVLWTISSSSEHGQANSGPLSSGQNLYLWLECGTTDPIESARFVLQGDLPVASFVPMNGFVNVGTDTELELLVGGCPPMPVLAGRIEFESPTSVGEGAGVETASWGRVRGMYR